jgi:uncharacterized membrane protein
MPDEHSCPACGHVLSHYSEGEMSASERLATKIADHVATWWFPGAIVTFLAVWIIVNLAWQPFEPYPVIVLAVISAVLASVAALQGPLILVTQRRAAERDRARDREALMVAVNAEADLHRVGAKIDSIAEIVEQIRDAR